jgi:hypothetical protein
MKKSVKVGSKIGALVGSIMFLFFGLLPGFYFGGYGTVTLIHKLIGGAIEPTIFQKVLIVCGMLIGVFTMFNVFIVISAILGALIGYIASLKIAEPGELNG